MNLFSITSDEVPTATIESLFQFPLVAQTNPEASHDTCKQTCKLECHSGSPVTDEELGEDFAQ